MSVVHKAQISYWIDKFECLLLFPSYSWRGQFEGIVVEWVPSWQMTGTERESFMIKKCHVEVLYAIFLRGQECCGGVRRMNMRATFLMDFSQHGAVWGHRWMSNKKNDLLRDAHYSCGEPTLLNFRARVKWGWWMIYRQLMWTTSRVRLRT